MFDHMVSDGSVCDLCFQNKVVEKWAESKKKATSSGSRSEDPKGIFTFERAWRVRCSEVHVLASRAENRSRIAKKKLVMADTIMFSELKKPVDTEEDFVSGQWIRSFLQKLVCKELKRRMPTEPLRIVLQFCGVPCSWHNEQCTLAEFSAYIARDVMAHIDLAAEARVKPVQKKDDTVVVVDDCDSDDAVLKNPNVVELADVGGYSSDDIEDDAGDAPGDYAPDFPMEHPSEIFAVVLCKDALAKIATKEKLSHADKQLRALHKAYSSFFSDENRDDITFSGWGLKFSKEEFNSRIAIQGVNIANQKKHMGTEEINLEDDGDSWLPLISDEAAVPTVVDMPVLMQGPAAVASHLLKKAKCTEEQIDAVALLALSLQKRFDERPEKSTHFLPCGTLGNNHRAIWLGGGGVGKTRTLEKVVEPLAVAFFGEGGYCATAQSNAAAQNLGKRGRTLHNANGLLMTDNLKMNTLFLNPQSQKKMNFLAVPLGVDVIDELGCVSGPLLHADALRKTYGRAQQYKLDTARYMSPQETWGRMPCKLLCGDFYQLPPVPESSSLLDNSATQRYEHLQGCKLLADMEYVFEFRNMRRFTDPRLVKVLEAMRVPGGQEISDDCWKAICNTELKPDDDRLAGKRGWYEAAYEWRIVTLVMHAQTKADAKSANATLFYIQAVDKPSVQFDESDFLELRGHSNVSSSARLVTVLPLFIGMNIVLSESLLPPKFVRGTAATVVGIQPQEDEPDAFTRASVTHSHCVVLKRMPRCVFVKIPDCDEIFLDNGSFTGDSRGVLAIVPVRRKWKFKPKSYKTAVDIVRTQIPLLPRNQVTLHGMQGKTADPGYIAHWSFPQNLKPAQLWLAHYVHLSRPRSFETLLCHGLPCRKVIQGGPPKRITDAFDVLFKNKIASTQEACKVARTTLDSRLGYRFGACTPSE